jgi:effector-binding domain-containing protein
MHQNVSYQTFKGPVDRAEVVAMQPLLRAPTLAPLALALACRSVTPITSSDPSSPALPGDLEPATVELLATANWKERMDQSYVFIEQRGDYRSLGKAMRSLFDAAALAGIVADGPPFALFFDDPARVALAGLRARVCLPIAPDTIAPAGLGLAVDVLPRAMVAYCQARGSYDELTRYYPIVFDFLEAHGWTQAGPVREVYLVNPACVAGHAELLAEIQIPWTVGG